MLLVAALLLIVLPVMYPTIKSSTAAATPDPLTCSGYPEHRIFLEGQTWWITTPGLTGTNFGHMHVGACLPDRQHVSGVIGIDVRIILHDNPGTFDYFNPVLVSDTQEISLPHVTTLQGLTCPVGTCAAIAHVDVDTALLDFDGYQEIRIRAYTNTPDGNIMHSSINALPYFANGKPINDLDRRAYERGKGWYTGSGYCEASFVSVIPTTAVSGTWKPTVKIENHGEADDLPVTHHTIRIDPDFHAIPPVPGTIVVDGSGQLLQTTLSIDTTKLANGAHRLHMRADCEDPRGSTNSGVLVVVFNVSNGAAPPPPTPDFTTASGLYYRSRLGSTTTPVHTSWHATDSSGVVSYQLQRRVNGGSWITVSLPSATTTAVNRALTVGNIYAYRVRATDAAGNASAWVYDRPFKPLLKQQGSTSVKYRGAWTTVRTRSASGGSLRYSTHASASARYTFSGSSVAWVAFRGPNRGSAKVYIDGVYKATISLYSHTYQSRPIVYARSWGFTGTHTIKIVVAGTKGHPRVDLDAFVRLYAY